MRIPQPRTTQPVNTMRGSTQPSQGRAPGGGTTGPQGTPGGRAHRKPGTAGRRTILGQEFYLWILVLIEVALMGGFRKYFRRFHGG